MVVDFPAPLAPIKPRIWPLELQRSNLDCFKGLLFRMNKGAQSPFNPPAPSLSSQNFSEDVPLLSLPYLSPTVGIATLYFDYKILNPYFLNPLNFIITEGFIPTYYSQ